MSLEHIRSECSDVAAALQPYVDGELIDEEQDKVAEHLEQCSGCRAAVSEQMWVRATLRAVEREQAPRGLDAKIMLGLDEVDREHVSTAKQGGAWSRIAARTRDLFRGGLVMLPAGAVAAALFFVARGGLDDAPTMPVSPMTAALSKAPAAIEKKAPDLAELEPQVGFPIQVAPTKGGSRVQLVGAQLDEDAPSASGPGARLRYRLRTGHHIVDRQRPAGGPAPIGTPVTFRGNRYLVGRTDEGEPVVHFERSGVAHMLRLEAIGAQLSADEREEGTSGDFSILLDMADQLHPR
jgi:anti-sigma factor (TIGR02949 family)